MTAIGRAWAVAVVVLATGVCAPLALADPWIDDHHPWREPLDRKVDFLHMELEIAPDLAKGSVAGHATYHLRRLHDTPQLLLDAVSLNVTEVAWLQGATATPASWRSLGKQLAIDWPTAVPATLTLRLRWNCTPRMGFYFVRPDADAPDRPVHAWTQGETEEVRHWLPAPDDPDERMTWRVTIATPPGAIALSNGDPQPPALVEGKPAARFASAPPLPLYLLTVAVGPFVSIDHGHKGVPVVTWALPGEVDNARRAFAKLPRMVDVLGTRLGVPYPFSRYGQVVVHEFHWGGMENASLTTLTHRAVPDARGEIDHPAEGLLAHELGHQWFGDLVTCRSWADIWLNEGWASYADVLWDEAEYGADRYDEAMAGMRAGYLDEAGALQRPLVSDRMPDPDELFDRHTYNKGAWIAHMLRRMLGDGVFFAGVRAYLTDHRFRSVETDDLRRAMEGVSGQSLRGFFRRWVHQAGHPSIQVELKWEDAARQLRVVLQQTQKVERSLPAFALQVEVALHAKPGAKPDLHTLALDGVRREHTLAVATRPAWVEIDPHSAILAEWKVEAPVADLAATLAHGRRADVRLRAVSDLGRSLHDPQALQAVTLAARQDAARHVRAKAAELLGRAARDKVVDPLIGLLAADKEPMVRRAVTRSLGQLVAAAAWDRLAAAVRTDPSDETRAAALHALVAIDRDRARDECLAALGQASYQDTVAGAALQGLSRIADARDWPVLVAATRPGRSKPLRHAAALAVAEFGARDKERRNDARLALEALLHEGSARTRRAAADALGVLDHNRSRGALLAAAAREPLDKQREQLRKIAERLGEQGPWQERLQRLESELQQLRRDLDRDKK
ncbi:MAG: M1 family metallopeptidase [Deltaproteobacteria bacterium]|nr:M1 family metallopeptidase [Deltaproteobacteria bacterium]